MGYNKLKLITATVIAVVLIVAMLVNDSAADWAVPLLGLLVGYVIGNAEITDRAGVTSPILSRE